MTAVWWRPAAAQPWHGYMARFDPDRGLLRNTWCGSHVDQHGPMTSELIDSRRLGPPKYGPVCPLCAQLVARFGDPEHVNLSEIGDGLCSCGAKPSAGEYIPDWWRRHTENAAERRARLAAAAEAELRAVARALDELRARVQELTDDLGSSAAPVVVPDTQEALATAWAEGYEAASERRAASTTTEGDPT